MPSSGRFAPPSPGGRRAAPSPSGRGAWGEGRVRAFITPPPARSARACARPPSDSRKGRRRCAPPDGKGSRPQADWRRKPARPRARPSAGRSLARSPCKSPSCRRGMARSACQHPLLERGAADVERKIQALSRRLDEADDQRDRALERGVAAFKLGAGEAVLQLAHEGLRIVAEHDRAHALIRGGDQHRAQATPARPRSGLPRPRRRAGPRPGSCRAGPPCSRRSGSKS